MKKIITLLICLLTVNLVFAEKASDEIKQKLIEIYTKYTEATTAEARSKYCIDPDVKKMEKFWGDSSLGYTPTKFGDCDYYPDRDIYLLVEKAEGRNMFGTVEIPKYAFFKKINGEYKLDWDALVAWNKITLKKYDVSKPEDEYEFRCFVGMTDNMYSSMKNYYAFAIRDSSTNYIFTAYGDKNGSGGELFDIFDGNETRPLILKIKYDSNYDKYIITEFVQRQWTKLKK